MISCCVFLNLFFVMVIPSYVAEQKYSVEEINRKMAEQRAFESVIWGIPAVNTDLMRQEMLTKTKARRIKFYTGHALVIGKIKR